MDRQTDRWMLRQRLHLCTNTCKQSTGDLSKSRISALCWWKRPDDSDDRDDNNSYDDDDYDKDDDDHDDSDMTKCSFLSSTYSLSL